MSTASERAAARRKAILNRGNDRLAKLTTSARGEDATYLRDESRATAVNDFVGESSDTNMPVPSSLGNSRNVSPSPNPPSLTATSSKASDAATSTSFESADSNVWTPEFQQQFMQALRAVPGASPDHPHLQPRQISQRSSEGIYSTSGQEESIPPLDAQLASLFAAGPKGTNASMAQERKPKTLVQKLVPVTHMLAMWCLLSWFVVWGGGKYSYVQEGSTKQHFWERLADLSRRPPSFMEQDTGVNIFWGFATLQLVLHSMRLFSGFDALQPPALLAFILPHLPPQLSTVVVSGLRYLQMGSMLLDDVAWVLVGLGFLVYIATWFTS